jgi:methylmalonyl-CoA mutase
MYVNMEEKEIDRLADDETSQIDDHLNQVKSRVHLSVRNFSNIQNKTESSINTARQGASLGVIAEATGRKLKAVVNVHAIKPTRGAIQFEELRLSIDKNEKITGKRPTVFLANLGPIPSHKARADFASGFFDVGGFDVIQNIGFTSAKEASDAAIASKAGIVVICGKDEDYQQEAIPLAQAIKKASQQTTVILAGKPSEDEQDKFKEAGISEFVHIGSDCYNLLSQLLQEKGVVVS